MDLLDNIATELSFEFHLYVVRDQLFGSRQQRDVKDFLKSGIKSAQTNSNSQTNDSGSGSDTGASHQSTDHDGNDETSNSKYKDKQ